MIALAIGTACVVVAGHPQFPAYAVATALLYLWRARGWLVRLLGRSLGIGATMAAWWPMLLLIRRSSRTLPLDPATNDIVMPYHRLLGLVAAAIDGWPAGVNGSAAASVQWLPALRLLLGHVQLHGHLAAGGGVDPGDHVHCSTPHARYPMVVPGDLGIVAL